MRFHEWFETIYIEIVLIARHVLIERDFFLLISREKPDKKYKSICLTSLTRAKCGVRSTLCWKVGNISGSTELFGLQF